VDTGKTVNRSGGELRSAFYPGRMCGRYASSRSPGDLVIEFEIEENDLEDDAGKPRYNVAPTATVPVVVERVVKPAGDEPVTAETLRRLRPLTWGLVPSWSKDRTGGARMINARVETLLDKPAYRKAALARRCLVPADGWYEWQVSPSARDTKGKPRKQPFFVHPADGSGLAFAGIYEFWKDRTKEDDDPAAWLITFAVITTAAEPGLDVIHDRMPLVLPGERWNDWLDPKLQDPDAVRALVESPAPGRFAALPVTNRVNSVRNDGPELLQPAAVEDLIGVVDPSTGELIGGPSGRSGELF
jgi:putative SOS response-associated peptidase YedK